MKERNPNLLSRSVMNGTLESGKELNKKIMTGLAITSNIRHDRVPSIPCNTNPLITKYSRAKKRRNRRGCWSSNL